LGITIRIEVEEDTHYLTPVSTVTLGVEKPHIELHVLAIVLRQRLAARWRVKEGLCCLSHYSLTIR